MIQILPLLLTLGGCLGLSKFGEATDTGVTIAGQHDSGDSGGRPGGHPGGQPGGNDTGGGTDSGTDGGTDGGTDSGTDSGTDGGTGSAPTPGELIVSSSAIDFGTVSVGDWTSEAVTLSNTGEESVVLESIDFDSSVFSWGGEIAIPYTFAGGSSRDITVNFRPSSDGSITGAADFNWDAETTTVNLSGQGDDPCAICAPILSVDTGAGDPYAMPEFLSSCGLIDYSDKNSLTLRNVGDQDLTISSVSINNDSVFTGGSFSMPFFVGTTLVPGASTSIEVTYTVTSSGADVDYWATAGLDANTIHILSNDSAEPDYVIGLTGLGICL